RIFCLPAEDGIRDATVTGVQTCALPICALRSASGALGSALVWCVLASGPSFVVFVPYAVASKIVAIAILVMARVVSPGSPAVHEIGRASCRERVAGSVGARGVREKEQ